MRLILTRHGETVENQKGIIQGHLPGTLSENGIRQAKKLAERLKDEEIDHIYSSDLARAADTAKEIAKYHEGVPVTYVKGLRERFLGDLQGVKKTDIGIEKKKFISARNNLGTGETLEQLYKRAKDFIDETYKKHKSETVMFVGHNGINNAMIAVILNKQADQINKLDRQLNTAVNIFDIEEDMNHKIHLLNCIKHLD